MKVVIIGGGISGLLAVHAFRGVGVVPTLIERDKPGGQFFAGGLRTFRDSSVMRELLDVLGVVYTRFSINGGILLRKRIKRYPLYFQQDGCDEAGQVLADLWAKCHKTLPSTRKKWVMADAARDAAKGMLRCDWERLITLLVGECDPVKGTFDRATETNVLTVEGEIYPFDRLVMTLPLWQLEGRLWFDVPSGVATRLTMAYVLPHKDCYLAWDYVYTPYTPGTCVQRLSPHLDGYVVEASGQPTRLALESDLQFLFPDGYQLRWVRSGLNGYLLPLEQDVCWPDSVGAVGRYAQWLPDGRAHDAYEAALGLAARWCGMEGTEP